MNELGKGII